MDLNERIFQIKEEIRARGNEILPSLTPKEKEQVRDLLEQIDDLAQELEDFEILMDDAWNRTEAEGF